MSSAILYATFEVFSLLLAPPVIAQAETTILFLGDSLTAGYGVEKAQSYPEVMAEIWRKKGHRVKVINGAESGSMSSSLPSRVDFYLGRFKPNLVVIAAGGNDARQLTPIATIESSLRQAIRKIKPSKAKIALIAMEIFPNLGKDYAAQFKELYPRVAKSEGCTLLPFLLTGVAGVRDNNQADGFHPNALGHRKIAEFIGPYLEKLLWY